jgi:hypothetical protein
MGRWTHTPPKPKPKPKPTSPPLGSGLSLTSRLDVAYELEDGGELDTLSKMEVDQVLAAVWPSLQVLRHRPVR